MDKETIRRAVAEDLKGKPSRNPASLTPTIAKQLGISEETVWNQVQQMVDTGHVLMRNETSMRLLEEGERYYFSSKEDRVVRFLKTNWPHITSNIVAVVSLGIAVLALVYKNG